MNYHINQLVQIENYLKQAYANETNRRIRFYLRMAIASLKELSIDLTEYMLSLESIGEQPEEVYNFVNMSNIDSMILDL